MAGNRPLWRWITAALAGVLAGLALPPWGCPPLLWCALVPLWALGPGPALLWGGAAVLVSHRWLLWLHPLDWVGCRPLLRWPQDAVVAAPEHLDRLRRQWFTAAGEAAAAGEGGQGARPVGAGQMQRGDFQFGGTHIPIRLGEGRAAEAPANRR